MFSAIVNAQWSFWHDEGIPRIEDIIVTDMCQFSLSENETPSIKLLEFKLEGLLSKKLDMGQLANVQYKNIAKYVVVTRNYMNGSGSRIVLLMYFK